MEEDDGLQEIVIPAFDVSDRLFGHGPPGEIRNFEIILPFLRLHDPDDFNFTKAVDKIE